MVGIQLQCGRVCGRSIVNEYLSRRPRCNGPTLTTLPRRAEEVSSFRNLAGVVEMQAESAFAGATFGTVDMLSVDRDRPVTVSRKSNTEQYVFTIWTDRFLNDLLPRRTLGPGISCSPFDRFEYGQPSIFASNQNSMGKTIVGLDVFYSNAVRF
ncbi:MAG: hypothetical protein ACOVQM_11785 [Pirellula sp.]